MSASDPRTFFVKAGPTRVRVRVQGSGPPLLLIMGIGGNLDMWAPLAQRLTERELIMFDFPGTGGSSLSWLPPTMGANALFVRTLLRNLGYGRVDVLGYSWGGVLAQHLAFQHRACVDRLVLVATAVGLGGIAPRPAIAARLLTPRRYYSRSYFAKVAPHIYGGRFRTDPDLARREAGRRVGRPPGHLGYAAQLIAMSGYSSLPGLPFIGARTLILAGDDDPIAVPANQRLLARVIRTAQLHIVRDAGHLLLLESPDVAALIVERFLAQPRGAVS